MLDRLAEEGVVFENAVSHTAWTLPGAVGLLSGHYPSRRTFRGDGLRLSAIEALREGKWRRPKA